MHTFLRSQLLLGNTHTFSRICKRRALRTLNSFPRGRTWLISPSRAGTLASQFHNQGTTHAAVCTEIVTLVGMSELDGNSMVLALVEMQLLTKRSQSQGYFILSKRLCVVDCSYLTRQYTMLQPLHQLALPAYPIFSVHRGVRRKCDIDTLIIAIVIEEKVWIGSKKVTGMRGWELGEAQMGRENWKSTFQHSELLSCLRACCGRITSHKVTSQLSSTQ